MFSVYCLIFSVQGSGSRTRVQDSGCRGKGLSFRDMRPFRVLVFGFRVSGFGFGVQDLGLRVQGLGFRV